MKEVSTVKEPSARELVAMKRNRQLFQLNPLVKLDFPNSITYWEQITCAGFDPRTSRLEAVVRVKQETGYNGNLCSSGSQEFVRFFVDFKDGAGFRDMGYTNFKVADISNAPRGAQHPLSYLAYLYIDDREYRRWMSCDEAVIPTMRAVLSWNSVPSNDPDVPPFYGNVVDADIELASLRRRFSPTVLEELAGIKDIDKLVDPSLMAQLKEPVAASIEDIYEKNKAAGVPDNRTFYSTLGAQINSHLDFSKASSALSVQSLEKFNLDIHKILDFLNDEYFDEDGKKANVAYEELTCVGLSTANNRLGAVVHIKQNGGYSGDLCTRGSMEHVAFWADWNNNGTFDEYLGTVSFNIHDIANIPKGGLYYNVLLPFDPSRHLKTCKNPNIIRIRAVLSWEALPSTTNPNQLNAWGNYRDALVQLQPTTGGGGILSAIHFVGGVDRNLISPTQYLYNYQAASPSIYNNRPWGKGITFTGVIARNGFNGVIKYRILYKKFGASDLTYQPVSTNETFRLDNLNDIAPPFNDPQTDPNGWFEYRENPSPPFNLYSVDNKLATWQAGSLADGTYTIRFVHTDEFNNEVIADEFSMIICNKDFTVSPTANTSVDLTKDVDLVIDGGDCHSYTNGAPTINGHVRAVHPFFASWSLELQPTSHTHGALPSPTSRSYPALPTGDANGTWSLNTTPLDPCGYTVSLTATHRVIMDNWGGFPQSAAKAVGFAKLP
jgi:hypothetical protein